MSHGNSPTYALSWGWSRFLHVSRCVHRAQERPSRSRVLRIVPTNWVMLHVLVVTCIPFTYLSLSWVRLPAGRRYRLLPPDFIFPIWQLAPAMKRNSRNPLAVILTNQLATNYAIALGPRHCCRCAFLRIKTADGYFIKVQSSVGSLDLAPFELPSQVEAFPTTAHLSKKRANIQRRPTSHRRISIDVFIHRAVIRGFTLDLARTRSMDNTCSRLRQ